MPKRDRAMPGVDQHATTSQPSGEPTAGQQAVTVTAAAASTAGADDHQPHLGPDLQAMIGQQLRAVYHEVLNEPVPERFVRLLEELAAKQADRT